MEDLTAEFTDIRDESTPQRDGTFLRTKRYTFYLGKYGPFVERIPLERAGDSTAINAEVDRLRTQIRTLAT